MTVAWARLAADEIAEVRATVQRRYGRGRRRRSAETILLTRLLATISDLQAEVSSTALRSRAATVCLPRTDTAMGEHARRSDAGLRALRQALEPLEPQLRAAAEIEQASGAPVHAPYEVTAPVRRWWDLHQALLGAEPWPVELLGPVSVQPERRPTPEQPEWGTRIVPALFTRGHHHPERFVMEARSRAREAGLPRPMLTEAPIGGQVVHALWAPPDPARGRAGWGPTISGDPAAVPVTVWIDPVWEGGVAPVVVA